MSPFSSDLSPSSSIFLPPCPLLVFVYNIYNFQIYTWSLHQRVPVSSMRAGIFLFFALSPALESAWHLIMLKYLNEWMDEIYFYRLRIVASQPFHLIAHLSIFLRYITRDVCLGIWASPGLTWLLSTSHWEIDLKARYCVGIFSLFFLRFALKLLMSLPPENKQTEILSSILQPFLCYSSLQSLVSKNCIIVLFFNLPLCWNF